MKRRALAIGGLVLLVGLGIWWVADTQRNGRKDAAQVKSPSSLHPPVHHVARSFTSSASTLPQSEPPVQSTLPVASAPPTNAADIYRKAFALLNELTDAEKKLLSDWKADADPALAAALCGKLQPIANLAHEATAATNCDWGITNIGMETKLPHIAPTMLLGKALVWNAARCRDGNSAGIADDLEATLRAGEGATQFLIGHLVNTSMETSAMDYLAAHASRLSGAELARLEKWFSDSQYEESLYRTLEGEAEGVSRTADRLAGLSEEEMQKALRLYNEDQSSQWGDRAQVVAQIRQVAELEREYAKALELPEPQYQACLAKLNATRQTNPFFDMLWPSMESVMDKTRATVVQRTMMTAALSLLQRGPNALLQYQDPASGRPFVYRQTADGFELESVYQRNGKPVVMFFPNR